jgi:alkylhydroperoxidase family enzyme
MEGAVRKHLPWVLNAILLVAVAGVSAQNKQASRVPLITNETPDPDVQKAFQPTLSRGGYILNLNRMIANAPKLMAPAGAYARALRYTSDDIPRNYREMLIVRTLEVEGGDYEYALHTHMARSCGVSQAQIDALKGWKTSNLFDEKAKAMLAFSDEMDTPQGVSDATYKKFSSLFTPRQIVELTLTAGWYIGHSHESRALHLPIDSDLDKATADSGCSADATRNSAS